jgi:tetratricopeptide (TPR) repeat protein
VALNRDADVAHFEWFNSLNDEPWRAGAATAHEHSDWFKKKFRDYVLGHFGSWVTLSAHKALEVLNGYEPPRGTNPYAERESSSLLRLLLWSGPLKLPTGALLPLALIGAWVLRREPGAQLVALVMVTQLVFVVAFFVTSRYRLPALPLAAILATEAATRAIRSLRATRVPTRGTLIAAGATTVLLFCCNWPLAGESFGRSAIEEYDLGDELAHAGKKDDAVRHLRASLAIAPSFADAHVYLGFIWFSQGRIADAIEQYRAALDIDPHNSLARKDLDDANDALAREAPAADSPR